MQKIKNIAFIGAGNVATQLGFALVGAGFKIVQVYSRTQTSAEWLAGKLSADFTISIDEIKLDADLYIISLTDDATGEICKKLDLRDKFVVHTSGTLPLDILSSISNRYGVFYPLQTFSKCRNINFQDIPLCLEANSQENLDLLKKLAKKVSEKIYEINSGQRKMLHLAAVFACNFPNFMYTIAQKILGDADLEFDLLKPLIRETAEKVQTINPVDAQTGPAIRGDRKIMEQHLELLKDNKELYDLYKFISDQLVTSNKQPENEQL
ncbi:MAG: Rossmann-like and DUF2520 domain-containing protein [Bacteroidales bacterium]